MYIDDFEGFQQQAEDLFKSRPMETRYSIKYRHKDGKLVLKVTDDVVCLMFKTDQQSDLRKLERLSYVFMGLMSGADPSVALEQQLANVGAPVAAGSTNKKNRRKG